MQLLPTQPEGWVLIGQAEEISVDPRTPTEEPANQLIAPSWVGAPEEHRNPQNELDDPGNHTEDIQEDQMGDQDNQFDEDAKQGDRPEPVAPIWNRELHLHRIGMVFGAVVRQSEGRVQIGQAKEIRIDSRIPAEESADQLI